MNLKESYKLVTIHLLEIIRERGDDTLSELNQSELSSLASDIIDDDLFMEHLIDAVDEYLENHDDNLYL